MVKNTRNLQSVLQLLLLLGILLLINVLANARWGNTPLYGSLDLTEEKRFTLTEGTRSLLRDLDDVVTVEILLTGELPANYKRLKEAIQQTLDDFRAETGYIEYFFTDPAAGDPETVQQFQDELAKQGIYPIVERLQKADELSAKLIYPYAKFYYKGRPAAVNFMQNQVPGMPEELVLENSIGLLEYQMANIIQKLRTPTRKNIAFLAGHGELTPLQTADLEKSLSAFYNTGRLYLDSVVQVDPEISAMVVAKPRYAFSEKDKFKIDQYVMNGGKVLWLLDAMRVDLDSMRGGREYVATDYQLNLDNLLFNYGIRIERNLVLDLSCSTIPLATGRVGNAPQFENIPYWYHPVVIPTSTHPIVKALNPINLFYPSSIDTTSRTKTDINRSVLLTSSDRSRLQFNPVRMDFSIFQGDVPEERFNKGPQVMAIALEGVFPSLYENRVTESMLAGLESLDLEFKTRSPLNRMLVVADGDIARNNVDYEKGQYAPLGFNEFVKYQFANKDFLINAIEYLLDKNDIIEARGKEVRLRLLNETKAQAERSYWQALNIGVPILFVVIFGLAYTFIRRRRYAR